jgi:quinate/shikimate dehydrogenase (NAD+)
VKAVAEQAPSTSDLAKGAGATVLVGLLGKGIQESRSPAMHEAEGRRQGITYIYNLLDTEKMGSPPPDLLQILLFAEHLGYRGLNVTYPYKQAILAHLDELSEHAEAVGSVNTVVMRDGRRFGHNTDLWGFAESFGLRMSGAKLESVLLLGAGGAGAAVAHALLKAGAKRLAISDVDANRAQALSLRLGSRAGTAEVVAATDIAAETLQADGIVNATPVGMASLPGTPLPPTLLRPGMWIADIVYFPLETELLKAARSKGCRTMDGADMAVFQAARAFEHFTGLSSDVGAMRAAFAARQRPPL